MSIRALSIAATGMLAQQTNVEVISNNIANMNTTAYTRRRAEFNDLLYQDLRRVGRLDRPFRDLCGRQWPDQTKQVGDALDVTGAAVGCEPLQLGRGPLDHAGVEQLA